MSDFLGPPLMINQTPPQMMSTQERLDEVAELMMRGVLRLKKRSGNLSLGEYMTGLQKQRKRPCVHKKRKEQ